MNTEKINRFEIIHHVSCEACKGSGIDSERPPQRCTDCDGLGCKGREVIFWDDDKQLDIDIQDEGRTLKVFVHERYQ